MDLVLLLECSSSDIAVEGDLLLVPKVVGQGVESVGNHIGMFGLPAERLYLDHTDESGKVVDFSLIVPLVENTAEVEEFAGVVDLLLESVLQLLLLSSDLLVVLVVVEIGENAHDGGEPVVLEDGQELKGLHLEAVAGVHHQYHQVRHLG